MACEHSNDAHATGSLGLVRPLRPVLTGGLPAGRMPASRPAAELSAGDRREGRREDTLVHWPAGEGGRPTEARARANRPEEGSQRARGLGCQTLLVGRRMCRTLGVGGHKRWAIFAL